MHCAIRFLAVLGLMFGMGLPVVAKPVSYILEPDDSVVGFVTDFGPDLRGGPDALQLTRSVAAWRKAGVPALDKVPAVFLLGPP